VNKWHDGMKEALKTLTKEQAVKVLKLLEEEYGEQTMSLKYESAWQLLIAVILSAQCTDERVNKVTKILFKKYPSIKALANADKKELISIIKPTGYYNSKANYLIKTSKFLVKKYDSKIPKTIEELVKLPGVGRKTANIVLNYAHNIIKGIAVDTHVKRLSYRIGFTRNKNPEKIEKDLMNLFNKKYWGRINGLLIAHGRKICTAKNPKCKECVINKICLSAFKFLN